MTHTIKLWTQRPGLIPGNRPCLDSLDRLDGVAPNFPFDLKFKTKWNPFLSFCWAFWCLRSRSWPTQPSVSSTRITTTKRGVPRMRPFDIRLPTTTLIGLLRASGSPWSTRARLVRVRSADVASHLWHRIPKRAWRLVSRLSMAHVSPPFAHPRDRWEQHPSRLQNGGSPAPGSSDPEHGPLARTSKQLLLVLGRDCLLVQGKLPLSGALWIHSNSDQGPDALWGASPVSDLDCREWLGTHESLAVQETPSRCHVSLPSFKDAHSTIRSQIVLHARLKKDDTSVAW